MTLYASPSSRIYVYLEPRVSFRTFRHAVTSIIFEAEPLLAGEYIDKR